MQFEEDNIKTASGIMYKLLYSQNHMLTEKDREEIYRRFDTDVTSDNALRTIAEAMDCSVYDWDQTLYLIANEGNTVVGFSNSALREAIISGNYTLKELSLSMFIVIVLLTEMYGGTGVTTRVRAYIPVTTLINRVSDWLETGASYDEESETASDIHFADIKAVWDPLKMEKDKITKDTKKGIVYKVVRFLAKQGFAKLIEEDDQITMTPKMDAFMDNRILDSPYYQYVKSVFDKVGDQQGETDHEQA